MKNTLKVGNIWKLGFDISLGMFIAGYNQGVFNTSMDAVSSTLNWGDSSNFLKALFSSFNLLGSIFGGMLGGLLSNKVGRRRGLISIALLGIASSIISMIPTTYTFGAGRFLLGVASGSYIVLCPMFITETIPPELIGRVGALCQVNFSIGLVFAYALGLPLPTGDYGDHSMSYWWIFMFGWQILVFFYLLSNHLFRYKFDTPYYMYLIGGVEHAKVGLEFCYIDVEKGVANLENSTSKDDQAGKATYKEMCCTKKYCRMMRLGLLVSALTAWSGAVAILFYSTSLFTKLGGGTFMSRVYTVVIGVLNLIWVLCSMAFIDKLGRKTLIIGMNFAIVGILGFLAFVLWQDIGGIELPIVLINLFFLAFDSGPGVLNWLYTGEITNDKVMGIGIAVCALSLSIVTFTFPFILEATDISVVFLIYASVTLFTAVYFMFDMIETKGLTKAQIYARILKETKTESPLMLLNSSV